MTVNLLQAYSHEQVDILGAHRDDLPDRIRYPVSVERARAYNCLPVSDLSLTGDLDGLCGDY